MLCAGRARYRLQSSRVSYPVAEGGTTTWEGVDVAPQRTAVVLLSLVGAMSYSLPYGPLR